MEIVSATIDDLSRYQELARQTFYDAYEPNTNPGDLQKYMAENFSDDVVRNELTDQHSAVFLLQDERQQIAGYIKLRWGTSHELLSGKSIELQRIYVHKEFYNKGLGKILLDHAEQYGRQNGFEWIWLCVWYENHGAIRFYERAGWKEFGKTKFRFGDTVFDDPVLKKKL